MPDILEKKRYAVTCHWKPEKFLIKHKLCCCPSEVRKEFGDFGNVVDTPPLEMWNGVKYHDFIANWGDSENCKKCNMRRGRK